MGLRNRTQQPFWRVTPIRSTDPSALYEHGIACVGRRDAKGMLATGWALCQVAGLHEYQAGDFLTDGYRIWRESPSFDRGQGAAFLADLFGALCSLTPPSVPADIWSASAEAVMPASIYYGTRCWAGNELLEVATDQETKAQYEPLVFRSAAEAPHDFVPTRSIEFAKAYAARHRLPEPWVIVLPGQREMVPAAAGVNGSAPSELTNYAAPPSGPASLSNYAPPEVGPATLNNYTAPPSGPQQLHEYAPPQPPGPLRDEPGGAPPMPPTGDDERAEREQAERERQEQAERERAEQAERERQERARAEQAERERQERARAEQEQAERAQREQAEREQAERAQREQAERERAQREEHERQERERLERERQEQERARAEYERQQREQAERAEYERQQREQAERAEYERQQREQAERQRQEQERLERERQEQARAEYERQQREQAERQRQEQERLERERQEQERALAEQERQAREQQERENARSATTEHPRPRPRPTPRPGVSRPTPSPTVASPAAPPNGNSQQPSWPAPAPAAQIPAPHGPSGDSGPTWQPPAWQPPQPQPQQAQWQQSQAPQPQAPQPQPQAPQWQPSASGAWAAPRQDGDLDGSQETVEFVRSPAPQLPPNQQTASPQPPAQQAPAQQPAAPQPERAIHRENAPAVPPRLTDLRSKLMSWLGANYRDVRQESNGWITIPEIGPSVIQIETSVVQGGHLKAEVFAPLVLDVPLTAELYRYVGLEGGRFHFGVMSLDAGEDGTDELALLQFSHSLLADNLQRDELLAVVWLVAATIVARAPDLQRRFGGVLYSEIGR